MTAPYTLQHISSIVRDKSTEAAPVRVQLSRRKGWRMPENTVSVARPTRFGNPFPVALMGLDRAIARFRDTAQGCWSGGDYADIPDDDFAIIYRAHIAFHTRLEQLGYRHPLEAIRGELRGKNLACWCPLDQACHADILLELANQPQSNIIQNELDGRGAA